jgi:hypothetical protein
MTRISAIACGALAFLALAATPAGAKPEQSAAAGSHVSGHCAGDTVSGELAVRGGSGGTVTLALLARSGAKDSYAPTGQARTIAVAPGGGRYAYAFNLAGVRAFGYRVVATDGSRSPAMPAAECAPGTQLAEAPSALLLPASLAFVAALAYASAAARRRRALVG